MTQSTLEQRVAALERQVAELTQAVRSNGKDWRKTVGMFSGDEVMKEIDAAGQAIREKERRQARGRQPSSRRRVKK